MKTALIIFAFVMSSVSAHACKNNNQASINENTNKSKTTVAASWLNQSQTKSTNSNQKRNK